MSATPVPDVRLAHIWHTIVDASGAADAMPYRNAAGLGMSDEEIAQAEEQAADWRARECREGSILGRARNRLVCSGLSDACQRR